jgi:hypothetical protein
VKIKTSYTYPPIPSLQFDWCAWDDNHDEKGPFGWGKTELDAILDLKEQLEEE